MYEYLIHTGIKGQKWGVRRFQNKDGTWTPAGKKRRAAQEGYSDRSDKKTKDDRKKGKTDLSKMSDDELRSGIARMKLEQEYKQYLAARNPKKKSKVAEVMASLIENAVMTIGKKSIEKIANSMFRESKPKEKPIDLDSLTIEKLESMNAKELDKVKTYADSLRNAIDSTNSTIAKKEKTKRSMESPLSDSNTYAKSGKSYFDALNSANATDDERRYYQWLGSHAVSSDRY